MKKILNDAADYVDEMLEGMVEAHPQFYAQPARRVIARAGGATRGKVGIVSGGGSGHLPIFTGYVGEGLLDACAIGDVFASPSAEQMAEAIRLADGGAGVLLLYGNYGGDVMNFDMAAETVDLENDIRTATVLLADDVLGELDPARRRRFWAAIDPEAQVLATGTSLPDAELGAWQVFSVAEGNFVPRESGE